MHIFRPRQQHLQSIKKIQLKTVGGVAYPSKTVGGVAFTRFCDGHSYRRTGETMSPDPDRGDIITKTGTKPEILIGNESINKQFV